MAGAIRFDMDAKSRTGGALVLPARIPSGTLFSIRSLWGRPMRFEPVFVGGNVIRFPVELRAKPSIALLLHLAPDLMEATLIAETFGLAPPDPDLRDQADRAMAERIALTIFPVNAAERRSALSGMVKLMIERAIAACIAARQAALLADEAGERLGAAQIAGGYWLAQLEAVHDARAIEAARLRIAAHDATQEAIGSDRAVRFALRGEAWRAFDVHEEAEILFSGASRP